MVLNCKANVLVFIFFAGIIFKGSATDSLRTEKDGDRYFVIHRVEKGETLYSLSKRYNAHLNEIVRANDVMNNSISLGQELRIPIEGKPAIPKNTGAVKDYHTVVTGETLYAISRKYGVSVGQLRSWNNLPSNEIAIGQSLVVKSSTGIEEVEKPPVEEELPREEEQPEENEPPVEEEEKPAIAENTGKVVEKEENKELKKEGIPDGFQVYYVQSGEMIGGIARKFNVRPDSIVIWNDLSNTYLSIGQKLLIRGEIDKELQKKASDEKTTAYGTIRKTTDQSGFTKIYEEGIASKIDSSVETGKYLALHRSLPIGTLVEVRNLMNNQKVFVRVVGKLPETGLNKNVLVRLTPVCFERLGVIDPKTRVEVSYYED